MTIYDVSTHRDMCYDPNALPADRNTAVPPMDKLLVVLEHMGLFSLSKTIAAPVDTNDVWLKVLPASQDGNGLVYLHDGSDWVLATEELWSLKFKANTGVADPTYKLSDVGAPLASLGDDGDSYYRRDQPGGIYYKVNGAWNLIPGTVVQVLSIPHATSVTAGTIKWATQADTNQGVGIEAVTPTGLGNISTNSALFTRILAAVTVPSTSITTGTLAPITTPADGAAYLQDNGASVAPTLYFRRGSAWVDVGDITLV